MIKPPKQKIYHKPKQARCDIMEKIIKWMSIKPNNMTDKQYQDKIGELYAEKREIEAYISRNQLR